MAMHPRAGQKAQQEDLHNIPALVANYFLLQPDAANAELDAAEILGISDDPDLAPSDDQGEAELKAKADFEAMSKAKTEQIEVAKEKLDATEGASADNQKAG